MSSSTPDRDAAEIERKDRGVLCAKCEHVNVWGRNECTRCGAHLYIACSDCGHRNERIRTRCENCGRRMHHTFMEQAIRRTKRGTVKVTVFQVVMLCIGVAVGFALILFFSNMEF